MQPLISNLNMFDVRRKVTRGSKHGKISKLSAELRDTSNFFSANSPMCDRPYKSCEQLYINSFIFFRCVPISILSMGGVVGLAGVLY